MAHWPQRLSGRRGFTLLEILVAVAVLGIGVTFFVKLFISSQALAASCQKQTVAAALAQEKLQDLLSNPAQYDWHLDGAAPGQQIEVTARGAAGDKVAGQPVTKPSLTPVEPSANRRDEALYSSFTWQAYMRRPQADSAYAELTVVVRWKEQARDKAFALTSTVSPSVLTATTAGAGPEAAK